MIRGALCLVDPSPVLTSHLVNICGAERGNCCGLKRSTDFTVGQPGAFIDGVWAYMKVWLWNCAQHCIMVLNEIICFRELSVKDFF